MGSMTDGPLPGSRIGAARRRAYRGKLILAVASLAGFAASIALARADAAGHARLAPTPLAAPPAFVDAVRKSLLQAGEVAPPSGPPQAATGLS